MKRRKVITTELYKKRILEAVSFLVLNADKIYELNHIFNDVSDEFHFKIRRELRLITPKRKRK